jgi:hypothetical protein
MTGSTAFIPGIGRVSCSRMYLYDSTCHQGRTDSAATWVLWVDAVGLLVVLVMFAVYCNRRWWW